MPVIKIQHICSSSSEDPNQPAENLMVLEGCKKWCCVSAGEKKAIVIMQLEKSYQIHALDIGNNGSAFVEVLVGRSTAPENYEPLLGMTTFMTPGESKQWGHISRVKMFGKEKFSKEVASQKWDRVKVVCTQPYNKNEKYGLSFIKLLSPPEPVEATPTPMATGASKTKLGAFALKDEAKNIPPGSLFFKKSTSTSYSSSSSAYMSASSEARMASSEALKAGSILPPRPSSVRVQADKSDSVKVQGEGSVRSVAAQKRSSPAKPKVALEAKKRRVDETVGTRPISKLLKGAVFVLSGFKNPLRGSLREKGLAMGAVYLVDWGTSCTHLVCAFPNTPKFNQVKGSGGLIVGKEWLLDCHSTRTRLPAKTYRLLSGGAGVLNPSEDDYYDNREANIFSDGLDSRGRKPMSSDKAQGSSQVTLKKQIRDTGVVQRSHLNFTEEDLYGMSTDDSDDGVVKDKPLPSTTIYAEQVEEESDCDTEDEVERMKAQGKLEQAGGTGVKDGHAASGAAMVTDHASSGLRRSLLDLPDFLSKVTIFLYGSFSPEDRKMLVRYSTAYGGHNVDYMADGVTHVVTQQPWDDNFDQALAENSTLAFVMPKWIFTCHQEQQCVPYQPFVVAPR